MAPFATSTFTISAALRVAAASHQVGGDTVITRDSSNSIVLQDVTHLSASQFSFA